MKEAVKEKFLKYGKIIEPFEIDGCRFEFFGELQLRTVHTTFFMKDYEIVSYLYLLSKRLKSVNIQKAKEELELLKRLSKKLLKTPEGHYLSTFILLLEAEEAEIPEGEARALFFKKSILFGLKGSFQCAVVITNGEREIYPKEVEDTIKWLSLEQS
ncbi:hypothetical protein [Phorcysia thermohydrogeniphila]|uniref:DUF8052 domain-containing protein n=1 Tax=Phorcysia thermohydrogeniphila TaxID=936138 RepID=A0A4R1GPU7_9BACT|nr:hypothetical protein [Phorcysia thermohydrogeniphila]TCK06522.1 hypothetical protein CLV27_0323 [Phorcysia thermohydrogeniphila]